MPVRTLPRRYHSGSTRQLTRKHAAAIRMAVPSAQAKKAKTCFLRSAMALSKLEIEELADVMQVEARDRSERADHDGAWDVRAPFQPLQRPNGCEGQRIEHPFI